MALSDCSTMTKKENQSQTEKISNCSLSTADEQKEAPLAKSLLENEPATLTSSIIVVIRGNVCSNPHVTACR